LCVENTSIHTDTYIEMYIHTYNIQTDRGCHADRQENTQTYIQTGITEPYIHTDEYRDAHIHPYIETERERHKRHIEANKHTCRQTKRASQRHSYIQRNTYIQACRGPYRHTDRHTQRDIQTYTCR